MNISNFASPSWFKNVNNWLPILQWVGWIFVAIMVAKICLLWVLYFTTPSGFEPIKVDVSSVKAKNTQTDVNPLLAKNLFGDVNQSPAIDPSEIQKEVAVTKLNLKLRGIYAADSPEKANAIIEDNRGKQAVYFVGEKLEVGGRVFLRKVFVDRVILETNGVEESLLIDTQEMPIQLVKEQRGPESRDAGDSRVRDERKNRELSDKLSNYRDRMLEDPTTVADVISGRPHFVDGQLKGFAIQSGKDKRLFQELGLRNDDVVTAINGVQLNNMADAMSLMSEAKSLQEVNVEIQRGGSAMSLLLNLNERAGKE